MSKTLIATFAIGIGLMAVVVCGVLYMQRGARVGIVGKIAKVRTAPLDEKSSIAVVDFRFNNPSRVFFMVEAVTVIMIDADGKEVEGRTVSESDAKSLFEGLPILGQKYNDTLMMRDKVPAHTSQDRMVAARFEVPEKILESRRQFLLRITDVDGPMSEFSEK